ncbi:MAG: tetratricopeptide repeat protein [Elusimicrobia bacterium]|nr:tetratricopeptide repeat protein [Elusimicrobiota bacterium]
MSAALAALIALLAPCQGAILAPLKDPLSISMSLFEKGEHQQVISILGPESLQKLRGDELRRAYFVLGNSYEKTGRIDKALGIYQLGTNLFPRDINLLSELARLLQHAGLEEQAAPIYQKVLDIHPNNASAHLGLAEIDHSLGLLERSAGHYEKALEQLSADPRRWRAYAEVLLEMREYKTAELAVQKALQRSYDPQSLLVLAFIQRASGKLSAALATLAVTTDPQADRVRALWLLEAGEHQKALAASEELLKASPGNALALWVRARARLRLGQAEAAAKDLQSLSQNTAAPFAAKVAAEFARRLR